jgi:ubiquinone/menaquinone biosynthesis C-methylase UbiE
MTKISSDQDRHYLPGMGKDWMLPLYDPLTRLMGVRAAHRRLVEQADPAPGQRVLEIGCGTGNLLLLVKRLHPGVVATGLDPDPKALARARRKAERAGLAVTLDQGFAGELPYPDASVDRVLSAFMFHHLDPDERRAALREVRRVLVPGGSLHLVDFGGAVGRSGGLHGRLAYRSHRLDDNLDGRIAELMWDAGLREPRETGHRSMLLGRYTYYSADV